MKAAFKNLQLCYEATLTGFVLALSLIGLGLVATVAAPTKTTRKPIERIEPANYFKKEVLLSLQDEE